MILSDTTRADFPEALLSDIDATLAPHDAEGNAPPHDPSAQSADARATRKSDD
jgi:hypothetical protein